MYLVEAWGPDYMSCVESVTYTVGVGLVCVVAVVARCPLLTED